MATFRDFAIRASDRFVYHLHVDRQLQDDEDDGHVAVPRLMVRDRQNPLESLRDKDFM